MNWFQGRFLAASAAALFALAPTARAALIVEAEAIGAATNNTLGSAQAIPGAAFTLPPPPGVFNPPGFPTATIMGHGGGGDVDFFSFSTALGGSVYFDIDNAVFTFDPILSLFDGDGTLIAFDDDSFPADALPENEGSESPLDSFLGVFNLPGPGTYYIAVSTFNNFADVTFVSGNTFSELTRPDGEFGGEAVIGAPEGISTFGTNGVDMGAAYRLHISLERPVVGVVPEPASLTLWGLAALGCAIGACRRRK